MLRLFRPVLTLIALDQSLKIASLYRLLPEVSFVFFRLTLLRNQGISFGLLQSVPYGIIAVVQAVILIAIYRLDLPKNVKILCLAGGISNLIDRMIHGAIIDYLHFQFLHWQWPTVINLADLYLSLAILIWLRTLYPQKTT